MKSSRQLLLDAFQRHIDAELRKDIDSTLATMTTDPHLNNIPTIIGGVGYESVRKFYSSLILPEKFFPADTEMTPVSRTVDKNQLADEIIFKFTHEHIYWDQASVLVQIGYLNPKDLPIKGVETAKKMEELRKRVSHS